MESVAPPQFLRIGAQGIGGKQLETHRRFDRSLHTIQALALAKLRFCSSHIDCFYMLMALIRINKAKVSAAM
jgi:hypothetical protein